MTGKHGVKQRALTLTTPPPAQPTTDDVHNGRAVIMLNPPHHRGRIIWTTDLPIREATP